MSKNIYELDAERLASTDEHGNRVYIYPEDVKGPWKDRRHYFYWFLIVLYLVLPWFYINGKPAIMVNIFKREFTFFGSTLYGVEPILFFLLVASGLFFIGFVTSLFGRVWCGWACPQTVFIQSIFLKIEKWIEGSARDRRNFDDAPLSFKKLSKKVLKWGIFAAISLHISHTFVGYFIGPKELFAITMHSPFENFGIFTATMIATGIILLDFGWFREQFCIIACPYGRIQSVFMDDNSLVVAYDAKRGEPRRGGEGISKEQEGDCINCYHCVKVCPTGIDIRRGTQLECIACTNCIDACDSIMTKLHKPKGLIRYASETELVGGKRKTFTIRSLVYATIGTVFVSAFFIFLNSSVNLKMVLVRAKVPFSVIQSEGQENLVMNQFSMNMIHQGGATYKVDLRVKESELKDKITIVTPVRPIILDKAEKKVIVYFKFNQSILLGGTRKITLEAYNPETQELLSQKEVTLVGPVN